jgi:RNA polymerase sigma factor (sigma-70 family)
MVYAAARRQLPDAALAEDVTQAVFMVLARRFAWLPANVVLSGWLLKVTYLACLQARRNAGRRKKHERKAAQMRPAVTAEDPLPEQQLAGEVDAALARLPEADRAILALRYLEQKSVAEVAQNLGISEAAAQKRIGRAMTRLREFLGVTEEQLGASVLGAFFMAQHQVALPAHLTLQVLSAVTAGGATGVGTAGAGAITSGVLKALFWSAIKIPLAAAAVVALVAVGVLVVEQSRPPAAPVPVPPVEGVPPRAVDVTRPAPTNVRGAPYPRIDAQRRVTFRVYAPQATKVTVDIGEKHEMTRVGDGYWMVTTAPLAAGFHYYQLAIDGAAVPDPGSETFFGVSKTMSGLEVPDPATDFAMEQDVPHGEVRARYYYSALTGGTRQAYVYTPPSYDRRPDLRYPVVYLLQGVGEDQRAWVEQGRIAAILDNLIAQGKAREMIAVMEEAGTAGGMAAGSARTRGGRGGGRGSIRQVLPFETIPLIDRTYRTIPDRDHRALAAASYGATQAFQIFQDNLEAFAYIGSFGAPTGYPAVPAGFGGLLGRPDEFARRVKLLFITAGAIEANPSPRIFHQNLENAGIPHVYVEVPGTNGGWSSWRSGFHQMAPLLFKD